MQVLHLSKADPCLQATITLDGSKSISNRALLVLALAGANPIHYLSNLSSAKDTTTLLKLLNQSDEIYDTDDAGTTFRFLTAFLALQPGHQVLTGSPRMRERPIGALVKALQTLGAEVQFLEKEGYPPLRIGPFQGQRSRQIAIAANVSSQFLSALALIGPYLPEGLEIIPEGTLVSRPYLDMTLRLMRYFGADASWQGNSIHIAPGIYQPRPFTIEADWSAASYWYAMAALSDDLDLKLQGLLAESWQGDAVLARMMADFGIRTTFSMGKNELTLSRTASVAKPLFEWDFVECPDIAQTMAVVCAGRGISGLFTGLETLAIKETDRVAALKTELAKLGVSFVKLPPHFSRKAPEKTFYLLEGQAEWKAPPRFATYGDHRMAMSFAPLVFLNPVEIENPAVVEKSYPAFWQHLALAGVLQTPTE